MIAWELLLWLKAKCCQHYILIIDSARTANTVRWNCTSENTLKAGVLLLHGTHQRLLDVLHLSDTAVPRCDFQHLTINFFLHFSCQCNLSPSVSPLSVSLVKNAVKYVGGLFSPSVLHIEGRAMARMKLKSFLWRSPINTFRQGKKKS